MGIHPFSELECPDDIICTGQVSSDKVNVDYWKSFHESLPDRFYEPLSKKVVTMAADKNSVKAGDVDMLDTTLIYARVLWPCK